MRLRQVRIRNFRCYRAEFVINFDDLTCLIARNDVGKSSVLEALDAFFNLDKLDSEDRSAGARNADAIEITCIFDDIQQALVVDSDALISPRAEYLLNADGFLEITKRFSTATPKCEEIFVNALRPTAANYGDLYGLTIAELRQRARNLGVDLTQVNQAVKSSIRRAIWSSVDAVALGLQEEPLEVRSSIWKPLLNALPLYQLFRADRPSSDQDAEAQDPIKFAIREALSSREVELQAIEAHVRQQVADVTRATIEKLREMDPDLARELNPTFSSFNWSKVFSVSLTSEDQIPLNKRGSGVRRLFLINFFRAKAEQVSRTRGAPDVILAIEEPETSQHPNSQLLLLEALLELSQDPASQVILTTHNPLLARKIDSAHVRFVERGADGVRQVAPDDDAAKGRLRDTLGVLPNHNVQIFIGVEGPNDIEFLTRISSMLASTEMDIPNLASLEAAGRVVFIPMGGSTLELWTNRLQGLDIPEVHIMDRDEVPPAAARYQEAADRVNARGGHCRAFVTNCREMENLVHHDAIAEEFGVVVPHLQAFDDVPSMVAELVHQASGSPNAWAVLSEELRSKKESNAKKRLNRGAVSRMTAARLGQSDPDDQVRSWLRAIGRHTLA